MPAQGIERVRRNLKLKLGKVDGEKTADALVAILGEGSFSAAAITPIETSTLVDSLYSPQISKTAAGTTGQVGYTASYAFTVHSASGSLKGQPRLSGQGTYWSPNAQPGFLTKGFQEIIPMIPQILKRIYGV